MKQLFSSFLLLLALLLVATKAYSDDPLRDLESGMTVPSSMQEYLESSQVIRYRYVTADIEHLWSLFESSRNLDDFDGVEPIQLKLFDDLSVELKLVKVNHSYWRSNAMLVTTMPGFGTDLESSIFASVRLERNESVSANIRVAGDFYFISPIDEGPIHVIWQADPEKMPNLD